MKEEKDNKLAEEQLDEANGGRPYNLYNKRPHQQCREVVDVGEVEGEVSLNSKSLETETRITIMEKNEEKKKKALDEDKLDEVNGGTPLLVIFTR